MTPPTRVRDHAVGSLHSKWGCFCNRMSDGDPQLTLRRIDASSPDYRAALHVACGLAIPQPDLPPSQQVAILLSHARRGRVCLDLLLGAYRDDRLVSAVLAVESPGATALVFVPRDLNPAGRFEATMQLLEAVQPAAAVKGLRLLQALTVPGARAAGRALRESGFRFLTRLLYLRRTLDSREPAPTGANDLSWVTYRAERAQAFAEAVTRTYSQSLDCPELTGLRPMIDVLAGHRGAGEFDPAHWWVARRDGEAVGAMLMNRISSEPAMEVVYMGVAQVARGTGVGDALLARATAAATESHVSTVALAVDERNVPARRLYARWGFSESGARDAWIATPGATRG